MIVGQVCSEYPKVSENGIRVRGLEVAQRRELLRAELQICFLHQFLDNRNRRLSPLPGNSQHDARNQRVEPLNKFDPSSFLSILHASEDEVFRRDC